MNKILGIGRSQTAVRQDWPPSTQYRGMMRMQGIKKINNNVAICKDTKGQDVIAMGKGIGFGTFPREISLKEVERTFYDVNSHYLTLVKELPPDLLDFSAKMIDMATNELPYPLSPNAVFTLADHIAFAMERAKMCIHVGMPLAYDVQQMYPVEYKIGKYALKSIWKEFHVVLENGEAAGIAMNILNAKAAAKEEGMATMAECDGAMLESITDLIEDHFRVILNRDSFNYSRYATHLQYLFRRIHEKKRIDSDNLQLYKDLKQEFPDIQECVDKIDGHIHSQWGCVLSEEEKLYLILHINRVCSKEGL